MSPNENKNSNSDFLNTITMTLIVTSTWKPYCISKIAMVQVIGSTRTCQVEKEKVCGSYACELTEGMTLK